MDQETSQEQAFEPAKKLVDLVLLGKNCSVICYGSTGSGKTHTLSGAEWKKNGIIQQAVKYARQQAIAKGLENFEVKCFMV
jgi:kinesin family protein 6/9